MITQDQATSSEKKLTKLNIGSIELVFVFVFTVFQYYVPQYSMDPIQKIQAPKIVQ